MALDPMIENLLVLQDRDVRHDEIVRHLEDIPPRLAAEEKHIAAIEARFNVAREAHKALELKRRELEKQASQSEEQRNRFRTQQLAVKKNDEYAALEKQIEAAGVHIDELETQTIEVMLELDQSEISLKGKRAECDAEIARHRDAISAMQRQSAALKAELDGAKTAAEAARKKVSEDALASYIYVKSRVRRPPYVVPIEDQHCCGCHLKVSNDVIQQARVKGTITRCDSCGRIVYI